MAKKCDVCGKGKVLETRLLFQIKRITEVGLQI